jgi:superfamily II DNA or RNA helicase
MTVTYQPGDLVRARGREWVVLPDGADDLLMLRPLGGLDDEVTGILPELESVDPASFRPPSLDDIGDHASGRLLLEAARLSTRASAGPFRSFGRIAVEPRPYQLVPLLMALKQETTRLLIADDVGIGKTVESCLIAKELLERGEADGLVVLCPAHLAEQWRDELKEKFHIDAQLLLPSTAGKLERRCAANESVFRRHRALVVSLDYIKSRRRVDDFVTHCPNLVIIDEAHTCASGAGTARQQRHALASRLAEDPGRHLLLVTATPHSGKEGAFQSLVGLLDGKFDKDFESLGQKERENLKRQLAPHLVQRRRGDIQRYLGVTEFPTRVEREVTYALSPDYRDLLERVLKFAGAMVEDKSGTKREHRVRWWSALALLRALSSSPAAAMATMRKRADNLDAATEGDLDEIGRRAVLDQDEGEQEEVTDLTPGGEIGDALSRSSQDKLRRMAKEAEALCDAKVDFKLRDFTKLVQQSVKEGYRPIVFCRFVDTAEYVANHLREALKRVEVVAVTGRQVPEERESRIEKLAKHDKRVLVCTDCLSEGVNLQDDFDAVMHYDLSWNPTRHEQREGRVDRFGQKNKEVRVLTFHGEDNLIDVVVLRVLIRKAKAIRGQLGVSIAVPRSTSDVIEELYDAVLAEMRGDKTIQQTFNWGGEKSLHEEWEARAEVVSRSVYAQATIKPEEVEAELHAVQSAIGTGPAVADFFRKAFSALNVPITSPAEDRIEVHLSEEVPRGLRSAIGISKPFRGRFQLPTAEGELYLSRTHPVVEGLASWVMDTALDPKTRGGRKALAARCGVAKVREIQERTNLLLLRIRYHLHPQGRRKSRPMLAEDVVPVAYTGSPDDPVWLPRERTEALLKSTPAANIDADFARHQAQNIIDGLQRLKLDHVAQDGAAALKDAHSRVRAAAKISSGFEVEPVLPPDVLGAYVLLPA